LLEDNFTQQDEDVQDKGYVFDHGHKDLAITA